MLNLKTTIIYFIITCGAKMVHTFAVSSAVRGYHEYTTNTKTFGVYPMTGHKILVKELGDPTDT